MDQCRYSLKNKIQHFISIENFIDQLLKKFTFVLKGQVSHFYFVNTYTKEYQHIKTYGVNSNPYSVNHYHKRVILQIIKNNLGKKLRNTELQINHFKKNSLITLLTISIYNKGNLLGLIIVEKCKKMLLKKNKIIQKLKAKQSIDLVKQFKTRLHDSRQEILNGTQNIISTNNMAIGTIVVSELSLPPTNPSQTQKNIICDNEVTKLNQAIKIVEQKLADFSNNLANKINHSILDIFEAYKQILSDKQLYSDITTEIKTGKTAYTALKNILNQYIEQISNINNQYLKDRAIDVRDLKNRLLFALQGNEQKKIHYYKNTILASNELTPTMLGEVPKNYLVGLISKEGSTHSHVYILAKAMNIPIVIGIGNKKIEQLNHKLAIIDGNMNTFYLYPHHKIIDYYYIKNIQRNKILTEYASIQKNQSGCAKDDNPITLMATIGLLSKNNINNIIHADGVGLYQTELSFLTKKTVPSEIEQETIYRTQIKNAFPKPLIARFFNLVPDNDFDFFPMFSPIHQTKSLFQTYGMQILIQYPDIFKSQLKALLKANINLGNLKLMLPMITQLNEVIFAQRLLKETYQELKREYSNLLMPDMGMSIDIPNIVYQLDYYAKNVSFFSVNTTNLSKYLLNPHQHHTQINNLYQNFHPINLSFLHHLSNKLQINKKPVSIYGDLVDDTLGALLLVAMGYQALSVNPFNLLKIKSILTQISIKQIKPILLEALKLPDAESLCTYIIKHLTKIGIPKTVLL